MRILCAFSAADYAVVDQQEHGEQNQGKNDIRQPLGGNEKIQIRSYKPGQAKTNEYRESANSVRNDNIADAIVASSRAQQRKPGDETPQGHA